MGGMASGGLAQRQSRLFLDDRVITHGAVGAHLPQAEIHPMVAQGCRPVGEPFTITAADASMILELGGRPPLERSQELAAALHDRDRELLAQGVHLGLVINESEAEPGQGDFLIRGLLGADAESGAVAVGDEVEVGQTVQFHVRDADSADEDLRRTLKREAAALGARPPAGALLFTCNGRGSRLFPGPDHDAGLLAETLGQIPVAGFFCAGEIGPVGGGTSCTRSPPRPPCSPVASLAGAGEGAPPDRGWSARPAVQPERPRLDRADPEQPGRRPRVLGEACPDLVLARSLHQVQRALAVPERAADDQEAVIDEAVHERRVLVPAVLTADRPR